MNEQCELLNISILSDRKFFVNFQNVIDTGDFTTFCHY